MGKCFNCKHNTPFREMEKPVGGRWDSWCDKDKKPHQVYSGCWCFDWEPKGNDQIKIIGW